jgi:Putative peptidoglycan binding domain
MRRKWAYILLIALLMTLASADVASAKRHRSSRGASRGHVTRDAHRGRGGRELSRRERRGRGKYAAREGRGRHVARSRRQGRVRYEAQAPVSPSVSRPSPGIPAERATEIQGALIKAGYMDAPASGLYDEATIEAMKKFQAANGMSQTGLPSAALLKKLGVPKRSNDGYAVPVNSVSQTDKKRAQE